MTSKERREARFQRRKQKREKRHAELNRMYGDFDKATSVKSHAAAYYICRGGVDWKGSVQQYGLSLLKNSYRLHQMLQNGEDTFRGFYTFDVNERGKLRHIRSVHISERCTQKALCRNSFVPMLSNSFIYDNGASLKNKGTSFTIDRVTGFLHQWYRHHGNDGYLVIGDFKSYFDNIDHGIVEEIVGRAFDDPRYRRYVRTSISHYGPKGLGLGSEENQIFAVAAPNRIDQYAKAKRGIRQYTRFNDDFLAILETKEEAREFLTDVERIVAELKITLKKEKTHIVKLSHGFTFLKVRFNPTKTGRVVRRPARDKIIRERRKLKALKRFLDRGEITKEYALAQYQSWRGQFRPRNHRKHGYKIRYRRWDVHRTLMSMDRLVRELFGEEGGCIYTSTQSA